MGEYFNSYQQGTQVFCDQSVGCEYDDSLSRIACLDIEMVDCGGSGPCDLAIVNNGLLLCDCEDSGNCASCANDRPYWNPVNPGDVLYFQFQQMDKANGQNPAGPFGAWGTGTFAGGKIRDCCTGEYLGGELTPDPITDFDLTSFVGVFPIYDYKGEVTWKNIQTLSLNATLIMNRMLDYFGPDWDGCWVFEFCFDNGMDPVYCLCSEPFKKNHCIGRDKTLLLEGVYPSQDCFGYYYGTEAEGSGTFTYLNQYRVAASLEPTSFQLDKTFVGSLQKSVSSQVTENWLLRTRPVPYTVAKLITNILAAKNTYIQGDEYISEGEVPKNNEEGLFWHIDHVLRRIECSKTYSCN